MLVGNGTVITFGAKPQLIKEGAVYIEGNIIKDVGSFESLKRKYSSEEFIDAKHKLILPGMINAHNHLYSAFARGITIKANPKNFIDILSKLWWRLDRALTKEDIYYSALIGLIECVKSGTTTVFDHHASPNNIPGSLDLIAKAAAELGVRTCLAYEVSDRNGTEKTLAGIRENERYLKTCDQEMRSGNFGLHASLTLSEETLAKCREVAEKLNSGYHIHSAEDLADVQHSIKKYGLRVIERLSHEKILGKKTIVAHCVHVSAKEIKILNKTASNVVHNPESNMNNAVGIAPVPEMLSKNIPVGLGTDGFTQDMLQEVRVCSLLHKLAERDPRVMSPSICLSMLYQNNAGIANRFFRNKLGELSEGAYADLILINYKSPTPLSLENLQSHVFFGLSSRAIDTVIVNGAVVMANRKLVGIDEAKIINGAAKLAEKLWARW